MSSTADAAFANGVCAHALDFDDSHPHLRGHPSATLVPAAMAVGEQARAPGADVLAAAAIGMEIAGKIGRALGLGHFARGWHTTSTVGIFATVAVAARLWRLSTLELQRAWGIAASQMSGLVLNFGTMTKPFHAGHAARCGVLSAWLARNGLTAHETVFDGDQSVLGTYRGDDGAPLGELLAHLGNPWEIIEPGIYAKRWPCCYSTHRPVGAVLELLEAHSIETGEVSEISIGFLPGTDTPLVHHNPETALEGKFSIEYVVAAALLDRKLTLETFTDSMVQRPRIKELMRKVKGYAIPDTKLYSGIAGYTDVAVQTPRGRFEARVERVPGSPAWPLNAEERSAKFMDCAARVLGDTGAARLHELCENCYELPDVRRLVRATVPDLRKD
jgi:2-methylcitrate dehydratase PrpD